MDTNGKNYSKLILVFILCLFVRLIPFRAPNIEPIFAAMMPASRIYGAFVGFFFAVLSILFYDILTGTLGVQTFFTTGVYGVVGLLSAKYFKKHKADKWGYVRFAIIGTLFFDAVTGLTVGPMFFHQSLISTFVGQIPFTIFHLLGNIIFAFAFSPVIYDFMIKKKKKKKMISRSSILNPKII